MDGKFIVFYGINSLGKSTQAEILIDRLEKNGRKAEYLKYPVYELQTGKEINKVLRNHEKQKLSELEFQLLYTANRFEYQPRLKEKLENGVFVVSEDYRGTGISWGRAKGLDGERYRILHDLNYKSSMLNEDVAFLFDGEPFEHGLEKKHIHETDKELMKRCRQSHLLSAKEKGWIIVNANRKRETITEELLQKMRERSII